MPYASVSELPDSVKKKLSAKQQRQFLQVWNSAYKRCSAKGGDATTCESSAFAQATGVVGKAKHGLVDRIREAVFGAGDPAKAPYVGNLAEFDLDETPDTSLFESDDGTVYRGGLIFRAGDYPDKNYSMTPEELGAAAEAFSDTLSVDLEHVPTLLDGQLGDVVSVSTNDDNTELHGIVALPKWLDALLPERKVSATWDRETKTLAGLALVRNPRVADAALMAAFAETKRHDTYEGQSALQNIHDETARRGAVCNAPASMASAHEASAIQKVHDMTAEHGAKCSAIGDKSRGYPWFSAGSDPAQPPKEGRRMSRFEEFMTWLKGDETAETTAEGDTKPAVATPAAPAASAAVPPVVAAAVMSAADKDENARLREENRILRMNGINDRANAFADKVELEGHIVPAQKAAVIKMHIQAATDDAFVGTASFADGESRVSVYEATVRAQPKHMLDSEALPRALSDVVALSNTMRTTPTTGEGPMTAERRKELMGYDPVTQAIHDEKYATGKNGTSR